MLSIFGTLIGVVGYGRLHDATGTYSLPLGIALAAILVASALFVTLRTKQSTPRPQRY